MTREEAKSELMQIYGMLSEEKKQALDVLMAQADTIPREAVKDVSYDGGDNWWVKNMREQIKAQADGEYISREAVIDIIEDVCPIYENDYRYILREKVNELPSVAIPSVKPQEPTGHWIVHPKGIYAHLICDKCLSNAPYDCRTDYCPNCGAKMVER